MCINIHPATNCTQVYTNHMTHRRRMKTKWRCLGAWRREVIRYRGQLNNLVRSLKAYGITYRYDVFFRVLKRRYMAFREGEQLQLKVRLSHINARFKHWR